MVKTVNFDDGRYIGDPLNAVRIFNEKEADELIVLDIDATSRGIRPNLQMVANLAEECRMPLCFGGGVSSAEQAKEIIRLGVEKVAISSAAVADPSVVQDIVRAIGSQSVVAVLDIKSKRSAFSRSYEVLTHNGTKRTMWNPFDLATELQSSGVGEIVLNSIDRDGVMDGYDLALARRMRELLHVPLTVLGGAGSLSDIATLFRECGPVGAAAGSLFVYKGSYRAVLINYPTHEQRESLYRSA